jgi:hypothetical protein
MQRRYTFFEARSLVAPRGRSGNQCLKQAKGRWRPFRLVSISSAMAKRLKEPHADAQEG